MRRALIAWSSRHQFEAVLAVVSVIAAIVGVTVGALGIWGAWVPAVLGGVCGLALFFVFRTEWWTGLGLLWLEA